MELCREVSSCNCGNQFHNGDVVIYIRETPYIYAPEFHHGIALKIIRVDHFDNDLPYLVRLYDSNVYDEGPRIWVRAGDISSFVIIEEDPI